MLGKIIKRLILFALGMIILGNVSPSCAWGPHTHAEIAKYMADNTGFSPRDSELSESFFFVFGAIMADMDHGIIPKDFKIGKTFLGGRIKIDIPIEFPGDKAPFRPTGKDANDRNSDDIRFARKLVIETKNYISENSIDPLISKAITAFAWGWYAHVFMDEVCNWSLITGEACFNDKTVNNIGNWDSSIDGGFGAKFSELLGGNSPVFKSKKELMDYYVFKHNILPYRYPLTSEAGSSSMDYWWEAQRVVRDFWRVTEGKREMVDMLCTIIKRAYDERYPNDENYKNSDFFWQADNWALQITLLADFYALVSGLEMQTRPHTPFPHFNSRQEAVDFHYQTLYSTIYSFHKIWQHHEAVPPWGSLIKTNVEFIPSLLEAQWQMIGGRTNWYINLTTGSNTGVVANYLGQPSESEKPAWFDKATLVLDTIPPKISDLTFEGVLPTRQKAEMAIRDPQSFQLDDNWSIAKGLRKYEILTKTIGSNWNMVETISTSSESNAFFVDIPNPNEPFEIKVKAYDSVGNWRDSTGAVNEAKYTFDNSKSPSAFSLIRPYIGEHIDGKIVTITWNSATDSDLNYYELCIGTDPNDIHASAVYSITLPVLATRCDVYLPRGTYYIYMIAYDKVGHFRRLDGKTDIPEYDKDLTYAWTEKWPMFEVGTIPPRPFVLNNPYDGQYFDGRNIKITWSKPYDTNLDHYKFIVGTDQNNIHSSAVYTATFEANITSTEVNFPGGKYYIYLAAYDTDGNWRDLKGKTNVPEYDETVLAAWPMFEIDHTPPQVLFDHVSFLPLSNPHFSPNGDGLKDDTAIRFGIVDDTYYKDFPATTEVKVEIITDKNSVIMSWKLPDFAAGWKELVWDGALTPDGIYTVRITATDKALNVATDETQTIVVDTQPPTINNIANSGIFSPNGDGKFDTDTLTCDLNDNLCTNLTASVEVIDDKGSIIGSLSPSLIKRGGIEGGEFATVTWDGAGASDGIYKYMITATDQAGNSSTGSAFVTVDTIPPAFSRVSTSPGKEVAFTENSGRLDLNFTVSEPANVNLVIYDSNSSVVRDYLYTAEAGAANVVSWDGKDTFGSFVPDNTYVTYAFAATDRAANSSSYNSSNMVRIDTPLTGLAGNILYSPDGRVKLIIPAGAVSSGLDLVLDEDAKAAKTFKVQNKDNITKIYRFGRRGESGEIEHINFKKSPILVMRYDASVLNYKDQPLELWRSGSAWVKVNGSAAGNLYNAYLDTTSEFALFADLTPPPMPTISSSIFLTKNSETAVLVDSEPYSKVDLYLNGQKRAPPIEVGASGASTLNLTLAEGKNRLSAQAVDQTGNISATSEAVTIELDTTPPDINLISPRIIFTNNEAAIACNAPDASTVIISVKDGLGNVLQTSSDLQLKTYNLHLASDGSYPYLIKAFDALGNEARETGTIVVDRTKPEALLQAEPIIYTIAGNLALSGIAEDANFDSYILEYGAGENPSSWTEITRGFVSLNYQKLADFDTKLLTDGIYTFRLTARDKAGNYRSSTVKKQIINADLSGTISSPGMNQVISGTTEVKGEIHGSNFAEYRVEYGVGNSPASWARIYRSLTLPSTSFLSAWDTSQVPDGNYTLRLNVINIGNRSTYFTAPVIVDNGQPSVSITSPASNSILAGTIEVDAAITDANFSYYKVEYAKADDPNNWQMIQAPTTSISHPLTKWNTTGLNGDYLIKATVVDAGNNASTGSALITVDNTTPEALITLPILNQVVNKTVQIIGTANDLHPANYKLEYSQGAEWTGFGNSTSAVSNGVLGLLDTTKLPDGVCAVKLTVTDQAGNTSTNSATIIIDNTSPTASIAFPTQNLAVADTISILGTAIDEAHFREFKVEYGPGERPTAWTQIGGAHSAAVFGSTLETWDTTQVVDGIYALKLTANDLVDNTSTSEVKVIVDNTYPTVNISSPTTGSYLAGAINIAGTVSDANLNSVLIEYREAGSLEGWQAITAPLPVSITNNTIYNWSASSLNGDYVIRVKATDKTGKTSSAEVQVRLDNIAPVLNIASPSRESVNSGIVAFTGEISDLNIDHYTIKYGYGLEPTRWWDLKSNSTSETGTIYSWNTPNVKDGYYTLKYEAVDKAGNTSSREYVITIDNAPAMAVIHSPIAGQIVRGVVSVEGIACDADFTTYNFKKYEINVGTGLVPVQWTTIESLVVPKINETLTNWNTAGVLDGTYTLKLRSWDISGVTEDTRTIVVDNTNPTASITSPSQGQTVSGSVNITGTASDANFSEYKVYYKEAASSSWTEIGGGSSVVPLPSSLVAWNTVLVGDGAYSIKLWVKDKAGNEREVINDVTVNNVLAVVNDSTSPTTISPNGDGVDDVAKISYLLSANTPVTVKIYKKPQYDKFKWEAKGFGTRYPNQPFSYTISASGTDHPYQYFDYTLSASGTSYPPQTFNWKVNAWGTETYYTYLLLNSPQAYAHSTDDKAEGESSVFYLNHDQIPVAFNMTAVPVANSGWDDVRKYWVYRQNGSNWDEMYYFNTYWQGQWTLHEAVAWGKDQATSYMGIPLHNQKDLEATFYNSSNKTITFWVVTDNNCESADVYVYKSVGGTWSQIYSRTGIGSSETNYYYWSIDGGYLYKIKTQVKAKSNQTSNSYFHAKGFTWPAGNYKTKVWIDVGMWDDCSATFSMDYKERNTLYNYPSASDPTTGSKTATINHNGTITGNSYSVTLLPLNSGTISGQEISYSQTYGPGVSSSRDSSGWSGNTCSGIINASYIYPGAAWSKGTETQSEQCDSRSTGGFKSGLKAQDMASLDDYIEGASWSLSAPTDSDVSLRFEDGTSSTSNGNQYIIASATVTAPYSETSDSKADSCNAGPGSPTNYGPSAKIRNMLSIPSNADGLSFSLNKYNDPYNRVSLRFSDTGTSTTTNPDTTVIAGTSYTEPWNTLNDPAIPLVNSGWLKSGEISLPFNYDESSQSLSTNYTPPSSDIVLSSWAVNLKNPLDGTSADVALDGTPTPGGNFKVKIADNLLVKTLQYNTTTSSGNQAISWDGKDANGNYVADGDYIYYIYAGPNIVKKSGAVKVKRSSEISASSISDIYVSPNGDGIKETASINYTLTENAAVVIEVTDEAGAIVKSFGAPGNQGANSSVWDGKNGSGEAVEDGEYTIRLKATYGNGALRTKELKVVVDCNSLTAGAVPVQKLASGGSDPVYSPDKSKIAYVKDVSGKKQIFAMSLADSQTTQLTSLGNNLQPVWSPDGAEISFTSDRSGNNDVWVMGSNGGGQKQITSDNASETTPAFSPDGQKVAYASNRTGELGINKWNIWTTTLNGKNPTQVTADDNTAMDDSPGYSPDGKKLVYASDQTGNFDLWTINLDGSVKTQVASSSETETSPAWSPDGLKIAYARGNDIYIEKTSTSEEVKVAAGANPAWSRDGTEIIFNTTSGDIYSKRVCAGALVGVITQPILNQTLTGLAEIRGTALDTNFESYKLEFSPNALPYAWTELKSASAPVSNGILGAWNSAAVSDGEYILRLTVNDKAGNSLQNTVVVKADNNNWKLTITKLEQLTTNEAWNIEPAWSPDGSKLAFSSNRSGNYDIWAMNSDGSGPHNITNDPAYDDKPVWSPDGTSIAFVSDRSGNKDIWVVNSDGSGTPLQLTNLTIADTDPTWSPDGTKIAFASNRSGNFDIWAMNGDGTGSLIKLTSSEADDREPNWSQFGLAFTSDRSGDKEIWLIADTNDPEPVRLTSSEAEDKEPCWAPMAIPLSDGRSRPLIAFTSTRQGNQDIYVMDTDGIDQSKSLTDYTNVDCNPAWSPDGTRVAYASYKDGNYDIWVMKFGINTTALSVRTQQQTATLEVIGPKGGKKLETIRPAFEWYGIRGQAKYRAVVSRSGELNMNLSKTITSSEAYPDEARTKDPRPRALYQIGEFDEGLKSGNWSWKVQALNDDGTIFAESPEESFEIALDLTLTGITNYPNPFSPNREKTKIRYKLGANADEVKIRIYDITGSLVTELDGTTRGEMSSVWDKYNDVDWDGRNGRGDLVMNGIYPYEVVARLGDKSLSGRGKIAVLK